MFMNLTRRWAARFWQIAGAVSVRSKIMGIALGLVLMLGLGTTWVVRRSLTAATMTELESKAVSVAEDLASRSTDPILVNNRYVLYQLISDTQKNHPDVRYIFIIDRNGQLLAHTFGEGFPLELISANFVERDARYRVELLTTTDGQIMDVAAPIFDGRAGTLRIGFTDHVVQRTVGAVTSQLLLATLLVSSVGVLAAIFLTWVLTRPILQLSQAARAVGQGNFTQRVPKWADDEIGELTEAFNSMVRGLSLAAQERAERDKLKTELVERVITAQEDERKRIARELHDQTSQSLVSLLVQVKLAETAPDKRTRAQNLEDLRQQLRQMLDTTRRMAFDLRPGVLDDLGLPEAIRWFAERCECEGMTITVNADDELKNLPPQIQTTLYRVTQEALSNVVKHSRATQAIVKMEQHPGSVELEISDNGLGFEPAALTEKKESLGLFGMRERAELLGGSLNILSAPGQGTRITVRIPVNGAQARLEEQHD